MKAPINYNLQALRGLAAYLIVIVHAQPLLVVLAFSSYLIRLGIGGVDLFFVISGFIMVTSTTARRPTASEFLKNRLFRVLPLYYVFTIVTFLIATSYPNIFKSTSPDTSELIRSFLFIPFEKSPGRIYPIYYLGWTLNYEMFFYAIFSIAIRISFKNRILITASFLLALVAMGKLGIWQWPDTEWLRVILYFYSREIMIDFILGMIIAVLCKSRHFSAQTSARLDWLCLVAGIGLFVLNPLLMVWPRGFYNPPTNTLFMFGLPAALIVYAAVRLNDRERHMRFPLFQWLGDISYSIYLSHFFLIGLFIAIATRFQVGDFGKIVLAICAFAAVAVFGNLVNTYLERPLAKFLKPRRDKAKVDQPA